MGNMGGFQPRFSPELSPNTSRKKRGFFRSLQNFLWGQSGLKTLHFPHGGRGSGHPGQRKPKGRLRDFQHFFKNPWGELWGKSVLKTPQFPYGYLWPGWLVWPPPPNGLKFQRAGSLRSQNLFSTQIFSQSSPQRPWGQKRGIFCSPKFRGEFWGKSGLKTPPFSYGFPSAWPPNKFGDFWAPATQANETIGESSEENGLKTTQFPYAYRWPGWIGWPPPFNGFWEFWSPPRTLKIPEGRVAKFFGGLGGGGPQ